MKSIFWKLTLGAACICAAGLTAMAAPLQRADVMADPAWVVHMDCDALRPTAIGQYVLAEMDRPEAKAKLAAFQTIFSFDLRTQLHGFTLYGTTQAPTDGVLIVYADFDSERLVTLAKAAKEYQSTSHNQNVIHSWIDDKKRDNGAKSRVYAAIQGNRVIFGQREDRVAGVLDVLAGGASLATGNGFPELGVPGNGHFIEAAARKLEIPDSAPNAAMLKLSKSAQFVVGEKQNQFQGALLLTTDSDEIAGHVLSIAQGLVALMKIQTNKPESVKLANALVIAQDGAGVSGKISLPASDVVEIMKAGAARKAAREASE